MILANHVSARMKCWENSEGIKECGDKIPPEYIQKGYQELSKGGIVLEEKERVKTKEELEKAKKEAAIIAREKEKERVKKARHKMTPRIPKVSKTHHNITRQFGTHTAQHVSGHARLVPAWP